MKILAELAPSQRDAAHQHLLAKLYAADSQWDAARKAWRSLAVSHPGEPQYLASYIDALLRNNETSEADLWLERLVERDPHSTTTIDLQARRLLAAGRADELLKLLRGWLAAANSQDADSPGANSPDADSNDADQPAPRQRQLWVAARLEEYAQAALETSSRISPETLLAEAERLYVALEGADGKLALAAFKARRQDLSAALELLSGVVAEAAPAPFAVTATTIIGAADDAALGALAPILEAALQRHNRHHALVAVAGDLALQRRDYRAAQTLYREVLQRHPANVSCLNNCALALALDGANYAQAQSHIERALAIAGPQAELLDSLGMVQLAAGNTTQAIDSFRRSLAERPTSEAQFHLALAHERAGDRSASQEMFGPLASLSFRQLRLHPSEQASFETLKRVLRPPTSSS
jgi:uncharacterized protein HemY